ncbi:aromatic prenyltransferase [Phaeosphaeriaceae sp. PMI808]|nr:aromatic prenyltransferase [Phaeosphaeriaceae sp. PMI808]
MDVSIKLLKDSNVQWQLWWETTGKLFARQLYHAQYHKDAQERSLAFFKQKIVPYLGIYPQASILPRWRSFMTDDYTPIELSWDWGYGTVPPRVRFSIEPVSLDAGTSNDPTNLFATRSFYRNVIQKIPGGDMVWHDHFAGCFRAFDRDYAIERSEHCSRLFYAFDFKTDGSTVPKAYFFPRIGLEEYNSENLILSRLTEAIKTAPSTTPGNLDALNVISTFLKEQQDQQSKIEMLAIDLINPQTSRLKIYFRSRKVDCQSVARIMTLNGRINGESYQHGILEMLQLWRSFLSLPDNGEIFDSSHRTAGIIYYLDFRLGDTLPGIKVYLPVRHLSLNDEVVTKTLTDYFEAKGRHEWTHGYKEMMQESFSPIAMKTSRGVYTYVGCSIKPCGSLKLISYLNPQVKKMMNGDSI